MTKISTEEIYEALFDDEALQRLPRLMAQAGNARSALMQWRHVDVACTILGYEYFTPQFMADYERQYFQDDPWAVSTLARPARFNSINIVDRYVPQPIFERSPVFDECIRAHNDDTFYCMGGVVTSALGQGILSVHRGRGQNPFEDSDIAGLARISVHVERVLRTRGELSSNQRIRSNAKLALDEIALVAIVVDRKGRIIEMNRCAEEALRDATALRSVHNLLHASESKGDHDLQHAISKATSSTNAFASTIRLRIGAAFGCYVSVTPLPGNAPVQTALVLCRPTGRAFAGSVRELKQRFKLSDAEAEVALKIAAGKSPEQIALSRGIAVSTIRAQMKSISAKTGCHRQAEIVSLVAQLPPF